MRSDPDANVEGPAAFRTAVATGGLAKGAHCGTERPHGPPFFPLELQETVARERLGLAVQEIPAGHLVAPSCAPVLADRLAQIGTQPNRTSASATGGSNP